MAEGRRRFLAGLLLGAVPLAAAQAAPGEDLLVQAQYYGYGPPPRRSRRRRCWIERRPVVFYDRYGRPRRRVVAREVCR